MFTNKDAGTPHDFALYKDSAYTQVLFSGDQITGPATTTYDLPALRAGHLLLPLHGAPHHDDGHAGGGRHGGASFRGRVVALRQRHRRRIAFGLSLSAAHW